MKEQTSVALVTGDGPANAGSNGAGKAGSNGSAKAWVRALELTATIADHPGRIFPIVIEELAERLGDSPALLSERECLTYRALTERSNQYARWALDQGIQKGEVICLLMPNRPEYMAVWQGITKVGGVVALLNTNLRGASLAHCIDVVTPKHIIAEAGLISALTDAMPIRTATATIWAHGDGIEGLPCIGPRIDIEIGRFGGEALGESERRTVTIEDRALYIYTSGTTGLPKAASVSHGRIMQWTHWFAGMMDARPTDRMYDCLPMYHSVGGVQAPGAVLAAGGSVFIREKFSARNFWSDVSQWDCTLFQYIGELCRYLLHAELSPHEIGHKIRMACGNGLSADVWERFKSRFQIPHIFEFYGATESNVSLFNIEGEPGAIGRIPSYLAHRFPARLVKFDVEKEEPVRNELGFCIPCAPNETGEAIGKILMDGSNFGGRFEGYTSQGASEKKILRNVFEPGDAWFRTGDLMRRNRKGFFFFVDRIGDTFRWKGENVATSEVAQAICEFPGIQQANVYGVAIPGADGRAGMAALVTTVELDLAAFRAHLLRRLPGYACPVFLRIRAGLEVTSTFKYTKTELAREGYDPGATTSAVYFHDPERDAFMRLDRSLYEQIQAGRFHWSRRPGNALEHETNSSSEGHQPITVKRP